MIIRIGAKNRMSVKEIYVPKLFPTHTIREILVVEQWYVREGDILQPKALMVSLEAPPGFFDIPAPPEITVPHRVIHLCVGRGEKTRLHEPLITLEPIFDVQSE